MPTSSKKKKIYSHGRGVGNGNMFMGWKEGSMLTCLGCYVHSNITYTTRDGWIPLYFLKKEGGV